MDDATLALGPLGGIPEGQEYRAYVPSPKPRKRAHRSGAESLMARVELVIRSEVKHLPKGADPEDFAQDIRELVVRKRPKLDTDKIFVTVHRWALNWCRTFARHHKEDATESEFFEPALVTEDGEDKRAQRELAHKFAEKFPDVALEALDQEDTSAFPTSQASPHRQAILKFMVECDATRAVKQPETPSEIHHKDGTTSYRVGPNWVMSQPAPYTSKCHGCDGEIARGEQILWTRGGSMAHPGCLT
jgi:hypothetical protein